MTIIAETAYGDAETRGKVRAWKQKLARDFAIFDSAYHRLGGGDLRKLPMDLVLCSCSGRQRAFEKINKLLGPGATLEAKHLNGKSVLWSIYKPSNGIILNDDPSFTQNCVAINYIIAGEMPNHMGGIVIGLWTLEVPDHALGRAVERSRFLHPGAIIREAHQNLLELPSNIISERPNFVDHSLPGVYIKAGPGCFVGHLIMAKAASSSDPMLNIHARVKTWLSNDQLHENQIGLNDKGEPGKRLGDGWLLPHPYKQIDEDEDYFLVSGWERLNP
jgi:hypothetical protein